MGEFLDVSRQVIQKGLLTWKMPEPVLTNPLLKCRNTALPMSHMVIRERIPDENDAIEPAVQIFKHLPHLLPKFSDKPDHISVAIVAHFELLQRSIDDTAEKINANAAARCRVPQTSGTGIDRQRCGIAAAAKLREQPLRRRAAGHGGSPSRSGGKLTDGSAAQCLQQINSVPNE